MNKGAVRWFNTNKGFGCITPEDGGKGLLIKHTNGCSKHYIASLYLFAYLPCRILQGGYIRDYGYQQFL
ncbi:MAG: cold shock domain-containing protein [Gammaproteobacteria bacterium]|nr:cold shock domain-containing protein [Gammaproteobacteria bacterium]MCP4088718.1 cold shock domain-containing protein [Gammaproteobacteria bacterium]MCP4275239.1 cold shock domain-containing protein [Gammaproteobacteria bacterium]MCP4830751.1 cold shock domain-containing protein [Gammaproteobacteria bacterium]MCP4929540.1 cold shock domain-containing protein [Gammaproteobacteria bacterium]